MFFGWARFNGYVSENPFNKILRPDVVLGPPVIYTVEETQRILETAILHPELGLFATYTICFFSGIRIEEVKKLRWEMFDWDEREILLPGAITKSGDPRNVPILDVLYDWVGDNPPQQGAVVLLRGLRGRRAQQRVKTTEIITSFSLLR